MWRLLAGSWDRMRRKRDDERVRLRLIVPPEIVAKDRSPADPQSRQATIAIPRPIHRQRILAARLSHTRLISSKNCRRLADAGVLTCDDLLRNDLWSLASRFGRPKFVADRLDACRRAIQLAASVDGLMPGDALVLVRIHRATVESLARQTPQHLRRDWMRFAQSSEGQKLVSSHRCPSLKRLKRWIANAQSVGMRSSSAGRHRIESPASQQLAAA